MSSRSDFLKLFIFIVLLVFCYNLNKSFPFYYLWDMDHTVTIDIISIFSNVIPTHINHPGVGTYIVLSWVDLILFKLNFISGLSIKDISEAISPIFLIYEITNINRFFHVLLIPIITFILTIALTQIISKKANIYSFIFIFSSIGSGFGLLYHTITIRSEIYSIFFFSIALFLISNHKSIIHFNLKKINLLVIGIFSGLIIFSKLQGIFYYIFLIFIALYYCNSFHSDINKNINILKHSILNIFIFLFISYISYKLPIIGGYAIFAEESEFKLNTFFYIFFILYIFPILGIINNTVLKLNIFKKIQPIYYNLNFLLSGFLLSIFSPIVIPFDNSRSLIYSLWNFKILFIRKTYNELNLFSSIQSFLSLDSPFVEEYKIQFTLLILLSIYLVYINRNNLIKIVFIITILVLITLNSSIAARFIYRDFIWIEVLLIISIFLLVSLRFSNILLLLISLLIINININKDLDLKSSLQSQVNLYGYNKKKHLETVYGDVLGFNHKINLKYPNNESKLNIIKEFKNISEHIDNANSVVKIRPFSSKMLSIVNNNLSINNYRLYFSKFPQYLEGFTVVKIPNFIHESIRFKPNLVRKNMDVAGKIFKDNTGVLPILHRWDIDIYILSSDILDNKNINGKIELLTEKVQMENMNNKIFDYNLYKVNEYTEISKEELINNNIYILIKDNKFLGSDDF